MPAMARYVFGELELDQDGQILRRADQEITLQPKVFDVLCYLIERRGRLVTKTELLDALWAEQDVNEAVVTWSVTHIRRALGQARTDKGPIETVHGRGYRFIGEVAIKARGSELAPPAAVAQAEAESSSPFVGRQRVGVELTQCLREAVAGHGSLCALIGEAGIGKTRCAEELAKRAQELGMLTLLGRCPQASGMPPLWPIDSALGAARGDVAARARAAIAQLVRHEASTGRSEQGARFNAVEQVAGALHKLAASQPVLLVVDDVHWADAATLQWLSFMVSEVHAMRVCVVITLRDREIEAGSARERQLQHVLRQSRATYLGSLGGDHVAELIKIMAGREVSADLAEAVRKASGGIPLFAVEVIHTLMREHGADQIDRLRPEIVRVPKVARDVLGERMRVLPPETFELIMAASVIGETFDLSLLASLTELEPEVLLERLAPAVAEGKVVAEAPHVYRFAHALFHTVAYDSVPASQRAAMHRKTGALLRERPSERVRRAEIARHYYASLPMGDSEEVTRLAREAGDEALAGLAFEDAARCFGWALEAQLSSADVAPRARAELLFALAVSQRSAGQTAQSNETCARAIELSMQHRFDDLTVRAVRLRRPTIVLTILPDPLARAALENVLQRRADGAEPERISALAQLSCTPPYDRDLAQSKQTSMLALQLAEQSGQRNIMFDALRARLFSLSGPDDLDAALEIHDRMIALDRAGAHNWQTMDAAIWRVNAYLQLGRMADADATLGELEAELRGRWGEALFYCLRMRALRAFHDGRFTEAEERWEKMLSHGIRAGVSYAEPLYGKQQLSLAVEREGAPAVEERLRVLAKVPGMPPAVRMGLARVAAEAGALDLVRAELALLGDPGSQIKTIGYLHNLSCFAVCAIALQDMARCEQLAELLAPYTSLNAVDALGHYLGSVGYFTGLLAAALGDVQRARADLGHAVAHNRAMGYRPGVVRALLASGKLEREARDVARARESFEAARAEADALGMRAATVEAAAALGELT